LNVSVLNVTVNVPVVAANTGQSVLPAKGL